jgi:hypothetical protein
VASNLKSQNRVVAWRTGISAPGGHMVNASSGAVRLSRPLMTACLTFVATVVVASMAFPRIFAQASLPTGQNIAPAYEGWEENPDGSFNLVFGYFNRNWDEEIDLPVGPDNRLESGAADQGQPTHFFPRRNRFVFRVRVPKDFGQQELVWSLTSHGKTEKAYATLKPDYFMDDVVIMNNNGAGGAGGGSPDTIGNKAPTLVVDGDKTRTVKVGQPVVLSALATDDGKPRPRPMPSPLSVAAQSARGTPNAANGLRLSWFVYRGPDKVSFDPPQIKVWEDYRDGANSPWSAGWAAPPVPPEGRWISRATFRDPGTYVLRCLAHDGGLMSSQDVTVVVIP